MSSTKKRMVDVLFIIPPYHHRNGSGVMFPLGIGSIMACLNQRHMTYEYIDCTRIIDTLRDEDLRRVKNELMARLTNFSPYLVGIGPCVTPGLKGLEVVASCCLDTFGEERVYAGGPFVTLPSQEWFFYERLKLKYLIKGEGEIAVCNAVETIKSGMKLDQCRSVSRSGYSYINVISDLNSLPFPIRINPNQNHYSERRKIEGELTSHIVASRGCPYRCDYCVSGNLKEIPFRKRSVESIVAEMRFLAESYGVTDIIFYDDCFFTGNNTVHMEIRRFCDEIKKNKLLMTWQIEIRPDIIVEITDDELRLLSECGCRQMNIGVEKTYPDGAAVLGKRYDFSKLCTFLAHLHEVCSIRTTGTFILGGHNETEESVMELILESTKMNLDDVGYSPLFIYPDTPIYKEMFDNPRAWVDIVESSPIGEVIYETTQLSKERLMDLVNEANEAFFHDKPQEESKRIKDRYHMKG